MGLKHYPVQIEHHRHACWNTHTRTQWLIEQRGVYRWWFDESFLMFDLERFPCLSDSQKPHGCSSFLACFSWLTMQQFVPQQQARHGATPVHNCPLYTPDISDKYSPVFVESLIRASQSLPPPAGCMQIQPVCFYYYCYEMSDLRAHSSMVLWDWTQ